MNIKAFFTMPLAFLMMLVSLVFPPKAQADNNVAEIYVRWDVPSALTLREYKIDLARKNLWAYEYYGKRLAHGGRDQSLAARFGGLRRGPQNQEPRGQRQQGDAPHRRGSPLSAMHGDIAFFTQPNINSSAGRAFTNYRDRLYARYERGFDEYRKSEYFRGKAAAARGTASGGEFQDKGYLDRRIKECEKEIRDRQGHIAGYEKIIHALDNGEKKTLMNGTPYTVEEVATWIERELELLEVVMDKLGYLQNCLDELGGITFNQGNIQVGYIVSIGRRDRVEVIGKGPKNITYKILTGGAAGMTLTAAYAEITEIIQADKREAERHPFEVGERFTAQRVTYDDPRSHKSTVTAVEYEIVKRSDTTIRLKEVGTDSKPITRKPRKRWNGAWMFSIDSWHENTFYKEGGAA